MTVLDHAYEKAVAEDSIEAAVRTYMQECEYETVSTYLATQPEAFDTFQRKVSDAKTRFYIDIMLNDLEERQDRTITDPAEISEIYKAAAAQYAPVIQDSIDTEFSIQREAEKAAARYAPVTEMARTVKDIPVDAIDAEDIASIYSTTAAEIDGLVADVREESIDQLDTKPGTRLDAETIWRGLEPALRTENIDDVMRQVHESKEQYIETARERFSSAVQYLSATARAIDDDVAIPDVQESLERLEDEIGAARVALMEDFIQHRASELFDQ